MIENVNYTDPGVFDREISSIFNTSWAFICLIDQLENLNDFVTYDIGSKRLVIQNFKEGLRCFSNVCLHRFNRIQNGPQGNAIFFCKYHSWSYNADGKLMGQDKFREELAHAGRGCLDRFEVERCGRFVFVKVNPDGSETLREHLGQFYDKLLEISDCLAEVVNKELIEIKHDANWKLLVENVLECYHCSTVHKETLVPLGIGMMKPQNHFVDRCHDTIDYPMMIGSKQEERIQKLFFLEKRGFKHESLRHFYLFPNLFITSTDGVLFYIARMTPIDAGQTSLFVTFVRPKFKDLTKKEEFLVNAFYKNSLESFTKVIYEDKRILENIQNNISSVLNQAQIFGEEEFRIVNFHKRISNIMNY